MSVNFTLRLDESLKQQAFEVFENYGLTPTQGLKMILKDIADSKSIPVNLNRHREDYTLSAKGETLLRESIAEMESGEYTEHETFEDFMRHFSKDNKQ